MACDRCEDIHKAQREGKTNKKCECDCHYIIPSGTAQLCTCGQTGMYCPVHGNSYIFDNSSGGDVCGTAFPNTLRLEPYLNRL